MASPPLIPPVAEVLAHPAYPTAMWQLEPDRSGLAPVAIGRGGPFNISWEVHGTGPIKLVFIMGLGGLKSAWQRQTLHFGHEHGDRYSMLVIDNRGMGSSDKPLMRYSSSEMALDLVDVLSHIGWLPSSPLPPSPPISRTLHIIGISLGGMIAQELALLIPSHISSLSLCCTASLIENTTTFTENFFHRASMLLPKSLDQSVTDAGLNLFAKSYLSGKDDAHLPEPGRTRKCQPPIPSTTTPSPSPTPITSSSPSTASTETPPPYLHFPTNAHRFVAQEMHKRLDKSRFPFTGFILQMIAAGWHCKTQKQLSDMADKVGRERILVMHGTEDNMISLPHGKKLIEFIEPGEGIIVEGMGHAPPAERWEWFNRTIEEQCALGERLDGR